MRFFLIACCLISFYCSCSSRDSLFRQVSSSQSNISFNNAIVENDSVNILDIENVYNGGGVGVGDFNNDGLQDLYFTGSVVSNKLYLNRGAFVFEDVTESSHTTGNGKWCRGIAVIDINNDGWMDIYVSATLKQHARDRENLLYINQGLAKDGKPVFKESAAEYGLADTSHATQAAFFDYDNDGDLDVYIANNVILKNGFENRFQAKRKDGSHPNTDKLFRNDWNDSLQHPVFTNVSGQAGITIEGYAHAISIADINTDGWKDIYVANDFISNDLLWINNHDGTFSEQLSDYFRHTSANAMGNDIIDINNDGLADVITLDMNPPDNYRKKMMLNPNNYSTYQNSDRLGYNYQYVRNTLQLNQGPVVGPGDSLSHPVFSDIGFYAGIAETDWSWAPIVADFDNDSYRDLIVTNGFPKDVTDHDFIAFRDQSMSIASKEHLLKQIPEVKLHNYAFRNNGGIRFSDVSEEWNMMLPSFSNGGVYADLDNDDDLDLVINNINDEAFLFENRCNQTKGAAFNYLKIQFKGSSQNINGIGAFAEIYYDGKIQVYENSPYRGYLSSVENAAYFGLGNIAIIDSVVIKWPGSAKQVLKNVPANQVLQVHVRNATLPYQLATKRFPAPFLNDVTDSVGIAYVHAEADFIDYNIQRLLPHKLSQYGPALAAGDLDGDGLDDLVTGGSTYHHASLFFQKADGKFVQELLAGEQDSAKKTFEDAGILLFDADTDGDLDVYIASGGYEQAPGDTAYLDRLFVNDGKGRFKRDVSAIPLNYTSKFCVRAADIDKDNDLDLFVSGRVDPWNYPRPVASFLFRNDSRAGKIKFTDVTPVVANGLTDIGMICDALFTDFDNDGWQDLVTAGEWMSIQFFKNEGGIFKNVTAASGVGGETGWWNSIAGGDFDNDGDTDYIVGNAGLNSFYRASKNFPVRITASDFDKNDRFDAFPSLFLPSTDGSPKEYLSHSRDEVMEQLPMLRRKYNYFHDYALATVEDVFTSENLAGALRLEANNLASGILLNEGQGKFRFSQLPELAQVSVIGGIVADDFDADGYLDVLLNGNEYGAEISGGRQDAFNGLLLKGDGTGTFDPVSIAESGLFVPGNGKALIRFSGAKGRTMIAASQNRGPLKIFSVKSPGNPVPVHRWETTALLKFMNGRMRREEISYGSSFLSQSSHSLVVNDSVAQVILINNKGVQRIVDFR